MASLEETAEWVDGIRQLEIDDPVQGGSDGISNLQAKQLAARTKYLKDQAEGHSGRIEVVEALIVTHNTEIADHSSRLGNVEAASADLALHYSWRD